jgi:hypothetical protein
VVRIRVAVDVIGFVAATTCLLIRMATLYFLPAYLLVVLTLLLSCSVSHNNSITWCPDISADFNSSGQTNFHIQSDKDWYISLAMEEWRSPGFVNPAINIKAYVSHLESTRVDMGCFYVFSGINA